MKKYLIVLYIILLGSFIFLAGCVSNGGVKVNESVSEGCGDGVCQVYETCVCKDCENRTDCRKVEDDRKKLMEKCNDFDECTEDIFHKETGTCEHKEVSNCCGNKVCEPNERCDKKTYTTICFKDCGAECGPYIISYDVIGNKLDQNESFTCGDNNCIETNSNEFEIRGDTSIKTILENIGEKESDVVTSNFKCTDGRYFTILRDFEELGGVIFADYLNDNKGNFDGIRSRLDGDNYIVYEFKIDQNESKNENLEVICDITIIVNPIFNKLQTVRLMIR